MPFLNNRKHSLLDILFALDSVRERIASLGKVALLPKYKVLLSQALQGLLYSGAVELHALSKSNGAVLLIAPEKECQDSVLCLVQLKAAPQKVRELDVLAGKGNHLSSP